MLVLKFLQTLLRALNSDGTPGQVAMGMAVGLCFGLTPLAALHNLLVLAVAMLTTLSFPGVFVGWVLATPFGFLLDPLFDRIGMALLTNEALAPLFTWVVNTPVIALSRMNNSVVLGSFVAWLVLLLPSYLVFKVLVRRYRADVYAHVQKWKVVQVVRHSKAYELYESWWPST